MKTNDLIKIAETAAMSFAVAAIIACVVWALSPTQANAVSQTKVKVASPVASTADGGKVTGTITNAKPKSNEDLNLVLNLENPTNKPMTLEFLACLDKQDAFAMMSRRAVLPKPGWKQKFSIKLGPGQKRKIGVASKVSIKAGEMAYFYVVAEKKRTNFSTAAIPRATTKLKKLVLAEAQAK